MNLHELRAFKPQILAAAEANRAENVRVFGSVARGDETATSDVDLLVSLLPDADVFDIAGLHVTLNELLPCKVDIVPDESVDPLLYAYVFKDAVPL